MTNGKTAFFRRAISPAAQMSPVLWQIAAMGMGVLMGGGTVFGGSAPFGLALVLGCAPGYLFSVAAGAVAGGLLQLEVLHAIQLTGAVTAALVMRLAARRTAEASDEGKERFWPAAVAGSSALLLAQGILAVTGTVTLSESAWSVGTAVLAALLGRGMRLWPAARAEGACLWLMLCAASLQGMAVGVFQPGLILLGVVGLALACKDSPGQAAAFSLALAVGCGAATPAVCAQAMALDAGVLLAAVFAPGERFGCGALFLSGCLLGSLTMPDLAAFCQLGATAGAALMVFFLLPASAAAALCPARAPAPQPGLTGAAGRLNTVAETLADIAETVNEVYRKLPARNEGFERVVDYTARELCRGCAQRELCWVKRYNDTMDGFNHLRPGLEERGRLDLERLPGQFSGCLHPAELCATVTRGQAMLITRREERVRCGALRSALTEQYGAVAQALSAMAEQLGRAGFSEPHKAARLEKLFSAIGLDPLECGVSQNREGRMSALVTVARTVFSDAELTELASEVSRICRREMALPQVTNCRTSTTLTFPEKPSYCPSFGLAGQAAGEVSGDRAEQFCDARDQARMLLCDGMGTGKPAAVDGALALRLTGQLLRAGFDAQPAARLVNVALSLKGDAADAGATLDLLSVDLFSGRAELFKAGAAPSFLVRGDAVRQLEGNSLPVGILETVSGKTTVFQMQEGDIAVMLTDGALADGTGWLMQQMALCAKVGNTPREMAEILAVTAVQRAAKGERPDDVTVAVMKLERSR